MDVVIDGERHRVPLETTSWKEARQKAAALVTAIIDGKTGNQGKAARETFNGAADAYLDERQLHAAKKTYKTDSERSRVLRKHFKDIRLRQITAEKVVSFQKKRKEDGVSGRTANLEVGLLRRIMKRNKQWARLADDVKMLPEQPKPARVLSPNEKKLLLTTAASRPEWQLAYSARLYWLSIPP